MLSWVLGIRAVEWFELLLPGVVAVVTRMVKVELLYQKKVMGAVLPPPVELFSVSGLSGKKLIIHYLLLPSS
jgi:hypothetical protein